MKIGLVREENCPDSALSWTALSGGRKEFYWQICLLAESAKLCTVLLKLTSISGTVLESDWVLSQTAPSSSRRCPDRMGKIKLFEYFDALKIIEDIKSN